MVSKTYLRGKMTFLSGPNFVSYIFSKIPVRRSDLEELGSLYRDNWMEATNLKTDDNILILKLNIEATSYDFLHKRTLEVTFPV